MKPSAQYYGLDASQPVTTTVTDWLWRHVGHEIRLPVPATDTLAGQTVTLLTVHCGACHETLIADERTTTSPRRVHGT